MGQTSGSDKDYIYKDKSERYHHMNTFYILQWSFYGYCLWYIYWQSLRARALQSVRRSEMLC